VHTTVTATAEVGDQLQAALRRAQVVIADLTYTWVCDLTAMGELCLAQEYAAASAKELRVVVTSASLLHQFALAGLDTEIALYPSLDLAMTAEPATAYGRLTLEGLGESSERPVPLRFPGRPPQHPEAPGQHLICQGDSQRRLAAYTRARDKLFMLLDALGGSGTTPAGRTGRTAGIHGRLPPGRPVADMAEPGGTRPRGRLTPRSGAGSL
jgi:hypothetical protein